jgi:hypothetical protein
MNYNIYTILPAKFLLVDKTGNGIIWRYNASETGISYAWSQHGVVKQNTKDGYIYLDKIEQVDEKEIDSMFVQLLEESSIKTFSSVQSAREYLCQSDVGLYKTLSGQNFHSDVLEYEHFHIHTELLPDDVCYLFASPDYVGAFVMDDEYFNLAIINLDCVCRVKIPQSSNEKHIIGKINKETEKEMKEDLIECDWKEARYVKINGQNYEFSAIVDFNAIKVQLQDHKSLFNLEDFDLLGFKFYKTKPKAKITFDASVVANKFRVTESNGMTYDAIDTCCVILPDRSLLGKHVKVTIEEL